MADNKDGMRTYAIANRIIAERNEAISQARFWRKIALVCLGIMTLDLALTFGRFSGWW